MIFFFFLLYSKYMPVNRYVYIDYLSKVWIKFITMAYFKTWHANTRYSHSLKRVPLPEKASVSIELQ